MEQSLYELEAEEVEVAKMGSIPTVVELAYTLIVESLSPAVYLLPFFLFLFFLNSYTVLAVYMMLCQVFYITEINPKPPLRIEYIL